METGLLSSWNGLVRSAALLAIIILALCTMASAVRLENVLRYLGVIVGWSILFIVLPAIIVSRWNSMTFLQHLGIGILGIAIVFFFSALRRRPKTVRYK